MRLAVSVRIIAPLVLFGAATLRLKAQRPEFEVAAIKVNRTGSGGSNIPTLTNGTLRAQNVSLLMLLQAAYDLSALRISGPDWMMSDRYDLTGKSPPGVCGR